MRDGYRRALADFSKYTILDNLSNDTKAERGVDRSRLSRLFIDTHFGKQTSETDAT